MISQLPHTPGQIEVAFLKMHGTRNHFVVLDFRETSYALSEAEVQRICDVRSGIGAEQVLVVELPTQAGEDAGAYAFLRIYQTDGTLVSACGNATRCIAHLLMRETMQDHISIETGAGVLNCWRAPDDEIAVQFAAIKAGWSAIPLSHEADTFTLPINETRLGVGAAVNVGNPHAVFFVDNVDLVDIQAVAPGVQCDPLFSEGANIGIGQVVGPNAIRLVVWERPGMLTEACGTGACAAAYVARRRGLVKSDRVDVHLPGGKLVIVLSDEAVIMTGPVAYCCSGSLLLSPLELAR